MATAPAPLPVVGVDGVRIELADGRRLIDGISSWWTACHGYAHPHIRAAVTAQLAHLPHVMFSGLVHEPGLTLARRLDRPAAARRKAGHPTACSFPNPVRCRWKSPSRWRCSTGTTGASGARGFWLSMAAITVTPSAHYPSPTPAAASTMPLPPIACRSCLPTCRATPRRRPLFDALLDRHSHEIAAVIVEPRVQGAGGMRFHDAATLAFIRAACDRHGILLIADEIMTGFGRTGTLFACESAGIVPDLMCLSKALSGGTLPLAATVASSQVFAAFCSARNEDAFMHGPTYMANPLACAAALASLDLFEQEPRLAQVAAIAAQMAAELEPCRALPGVVDVRVMGAIGVVQLATTEASLLAPRLRRTRRLGAPLRRHHLLDAALRHFASRPDDPDCCRL